MEKKTNKATDNKVTVHKSNNHAEYKLKKLHEQLLKSGKAIAGIITAVLIISVIGGLYTNHFEQTSPAMSGIILRDIKPKAANITPLVRYQLNHTAYGIVNYSGNDGLHSATIRLKDRKIVKDELVDMYTDGNNPMVLAQLLHDLYPKNKDEITLTKLKTSPSKITINQNTYQVNVHATNLNSYIDQKTKKQVVVKDNPNYLLLGDGTQRTFKRKHVNPKTIQVTAIHFNNSDKKNVISFMDYNSGKNYRITLDLHNNVSLYDLG